MGAFISTGELKTVQKTESQLSEVLYDELATDLEVSKKVYKVVLLGAGNAGKSTIFKQLNIIYGSGITQDDKKNKTQEIYDSILSQMKNVIISCKEEHEFKLDDQIEKSVQFIERLPRNTQINVEIGEHLTKLWNDKNIKMTFSQRSNLGIEASTAYFLFDIERIAKDNYLPTEKDIILANIPTTGISELSLKIGNNTFEIYDTGGQRSERSKWIHTFNNANAIIYVTPLSCYDLCLYEQRDFNAMDESIQLFGQVINNKYFRNNKISMILFLNKLDLFELKIEEVSLKKWDKEYKGELGDSENAIKYITNKHLQQNNNKNKTIYVHTLCAIQMEEVKNVFNKVQKIIVNNAFTKNGRNFGVKNCYLN